MVPIKKVTFKSFTPFTNCLSRITNTQVDDASYTDAVMPMYNLIEDSNDYSKTSGILWKYCRDELAIIIADGVTAAFTDDKAPTDSFKLKQEITDQTRHNDTKNVERMVLLKYLSNILRTF